MVAAAGAIPRLAGAVGPDGRMSVVVVWLNGVVASTVGRGAR